MTRFRVAFCDYSAEENPAADEHRLLDRDGILALMEEVLKSAGSFVSVMDDEGTMLQFVLDEDGSVMMDIPHPKKRGSYAKRATIADCVSVVEALDERVRIDAITGLEFERW